MADKPTKKRGPRLVVLGIILAVLGFLALMLNVFNVYGKAAKNCIGNASTCNLSNNQTIAHIGIVVFFVGLAIVVIGIVMHLADSAHNKS